MERTKILTEDELRTAIGALELREDFDIVLAIGRGGILPGKLLAERLDVPMDTILIHYRNEYNVVAHDEPHMVAPPSASLEGKRVLLVDDFFRSGATLKKARELIHGAARVATFVISDLNDGADYHVRNQRGLLFPFAL